MDFEVKRKMKIMEWRWHGTFSPVLWANWRPTKSSKPCQKTTSCLSIKVWDVFSCIVYSGLRWLPQNTYTTNKSLKITTAVAANRVHWRSCVYIQILLHWLQKHYGNSWGKGVSEWFVVRTGEKYNTDTTLHANHSDTTDDGLCTVSVRLGNH